MNKIQFCHISMIQQDLFFNIICSDLFTFTLRRELLSVYNKNIGKNILKRELEVQNAPSLV